MDTGKRDRVPRGSRTKAVAAFWVVAFCLLAYLPEPLAERAVYVGYQKCKGCHVEEYQTWERGRHAKALASLKKAERKDGRCLQCHATGFAQPASLGQLFENVQCEACHGPGSLYKGPTIMSKGRFLEDPEAQRKLSLEAGMTPVEEGICRECHGKARPEGHPPPGPFYFRDAIGKVSHKAH